ncbi:hypothetical protein GCM10011349_20240 [Novosphingobium indicum]|uniref:Uncharacterized protein n=1 Tax=Novosphingobium indicum TaxID=462949 RepID=A0ABQ2JL69_9SPHN|nr:hypothetical protein [Novosphingobium indicum]GGN49517.1 hypothetical protein GCM10011349_20240 [Novosphingobium indicum]
MSKDDLYDQLRRQQLELAVAQKQMHDSYKEAVESHFLAVEKEMAVIAARTSLGLRNVALAMDALRRDAPEFDKRLRDILESSNDLWSMAERLAATGGENGGS